MFILELEPESPVNEVWEWSSDVMVSHNGTEQRVSRRGAAPRYMVDIKVMATTKGEVNKAWHRILASRNRLLVPEFQIATVTTQDCPASSYKIFCNTAKTDIRLTESFYIVGYGKVEVDSIDFDGINVEVALLTTIKKNTMIAPIHEMVLTSQPSITRMSVNEVATFAIKGTFNKTRSTLTRPGVTETLTLFDDVPVLDVRPMGGNTNESVIEDDFVIDNDISEITIINKWEQAKVKVSNSYLIDKMYSGSCDSETLRSFDYWREFLEYCRGSQKKFWLPTYRDDLLIVGTLEEEADSILIEDQDYALTLFFDQDTHIYLEIVTTQGLHRCTITGVGSEGDNTRCDITPVLPLAWGELEPEDVVRVSFLIPTRIDGDYVSWEHYQSHSMLNISFRSAENE